MADEEKVDETTETPVEDDVQTDEVKDEAKPEPTEDDTTTDKHGHPGISQGKYRRDMEAKDREIQELKDQIAEAAKTDEGRAELERKIEELETKHADEKLDYELELAGCVDTKAARAVLDDHGNSIDQLKADCPYLFTQHKPTGSTGLKPEGAPSGADARLAEARKAAGIKSKG